MTCCIEGQLEKLAVKDGDLLVWRTADDLSEKLSFLHALEACLEPRNLKCLFLRPGDCLAVADDALLDSLGLMRKANQ